MRVFACRMLFVTSCFNMNGLLVVLAIAGFLQNPSAAAGDESPDARSRLFNDLLRSYNKLVVPQPANNSAINVTMHMELLRVIDLDMDKQILSLDTWISFSWRNPHLSWSRRKYGGIRNIRVPNRLIWIPDIKLFNNAGPRAGNTHNKDINAVITYDGYVFFTPPIQTMSYCNLDRNLTSGHVVTCTLKFGSWSYDGQVIDLQNHSSGEEVGLGEFDGEFNKEWELVGTSVERNVKQYACCPDIFIDIVYTVNLRYRG